MSYFYHIRPFTDRILRPGFLHQFQSIIEFVVHHFISSIIQNESLLLEANRLGFSDKQISIYCDSTEDEIRALHQQFVIRPFIKQINTISENMSSSDEDFRFIGTLDLMNDLQEKLFMLDDDGEHRIVQAVLILSEDTNDESSITVYTTIPTFNWISSLGLLESYSTTIPTDNNHQDPLLNFNNDDDSGTYKTHLRQLQSFLKLNLKQKEEDKGNNEF
ncbi:unnamed protein product [Rotaria sp. Silwood1]|nr:unnamed protein product [Rotaria sp. Silwood1]